MKSEKDTDSGGARRWYDDACGAALALEFVGERWSLLVIRELMFGPRRFSDLKADLTGISANVLTQRLAGLERTGILRRCQLPPPARVQAYELTSWGYEAEPIFQALGRWAVRSPLHDPMRPLSAVSTMLSLRTMLRPDREPLAMTLAFRFPDSAFVGRLSPAGLEIERGESDAVDVGFDTDTTTTFVTLVYAGRPFAEAEAAGALRLTGDRGLAARFVDCFALPDKIAAGAR
ncbi:helix-turn-helix domain-containing protein [Luteimonas sp. FCS-9]|uniref:winged helix-turn-helix transcriptional regulator n=1 Tax=Luteimonas sp. FCS-9 TaxID=1547516 RepID=UPI00063E86CC|nr:helix-turn-helix domain-containing protein [Luteimonas sp. FCS-9]KLJ01107.1 transcriptional regulator [Luteimonas sp. FCS-9]